ncbi:MAG: hypothetical protein ABIR68_11785 [Ilumatobacteraceae bacterium]
MIAPGVPDADTKLSKIFWDSTVGNVNGRGTVVAGSVVAGSVVAGSVVATIVDVVAGSVAATLVDALEDDPLAHADAATRQIDSAIAVRLAVVQARR